MTVTLSSIARKVGVSPSTVADILKGRPGYSAATCEKVKNAAKELNYVPNYFARGLQQKRSKIIGFAGNLSVTSMTGQLIKSVNDFLREKGYLPLFCDASRQGEVHNWAIREMQARCVDGIIFSGGIDDATLDKVLPEDMPCVMIRNDINEKRNCVITDREEVFENLVKMLYGRGHRKIAFLGYDNEEAMKKKNNCHTRKITGYMAGMESCGLNGEEFLFSCPYGGGNIRSFISHNKNIFKDLTAVIACNDCAAVEVLTELSAIGVNVPWDCSVTGFDNTPFASAVEPVITTFDPSYEDVGRAAVDMMFRLLDGDDGESIVKIIPRMIEGKSVADCPQ